MEIWCRVRSKENMHVMGFYAFSWYKLSMHLRVWWWMRSNRSEIIMH